jgi:hypothetical protein
MRPVGYVPITYGGPPRAGFLFRVESSLVARRWTASRPCPKGGTHHDRFLLEEGLEGPGCRIARIQTEARGSTIPEASGVSRAHQRRHAYPGARALVSSLACRSGSPTGQAGARDGGTLCRSGGPGEGRTRTPDPDGRPLATAQSHQQRPRGVTRPKPRPLR